MGVKIFGITITAVVAAVTITALIIAGSPATEREHRFDDQRLSDLRQIAAAVDFYYSKTGRLPASLKDLVKPEVARLYYIRSTTDPQTSKSYEYSPIGKSGYKLCANFIYSNIEEIRRNISEDKKAWAHPAGYKCFDLNAPPSKASGNQ